MAEEALLKDHLCVSQPYLAQANLFQHASPAPHLSLPLSLPSCGPGEQTAPSEASSSPLLLALSYLARIDVLSHVAELDREQKRGQSSMSQLEP